MVNLVTKANAVSCLLFHVEHQPGLKWFWRWRITGNYPPPYLHWREGESTAARLVFHPEIAGCTVEAQWRPGPDEEWRQAALRECAIGTAEFHIRAERDFIAPRGFSAVADVGDMVACYLFGPLDLRAGVETIIEGRAEGAFPDNVLLLPGEFVSEDEMIRLENRDPSIGSLIIPVEQDARLAAVPGAEARQLFAVKRKPSIPQSSI